MLRKFLKVPNVTAKTNLGRIKRALAEPVRQIANNAGFEDAVVVQHVREGERGFEFDAGTGMYEDLF